MASRDVESRIRLIQRGLGKAGFELDLMLKNRRLYPHTLHEMARQFEGMAHEIRTGLLGDSDSG